LPVLGDENYLEKVYKLIENQSLSNEITMGNVKRSMPSLPKVLNAVANYYNMSYSKLCKNSQGQSNNVRVIAMIVCQETTMNTLKEIGKQMGGVSYASISMAIKRFKLKAKQKKEILEIIQQLQDSEK
jgi:chromosomal replication initiation ATPase DnaA